MTEPYVTGKQVAEHLGIGIKSWSSNELRFNLPFILVGNVRRYRISEVEAYLLEQTAAQMETYMTKTRVKRNVAKAKPAKRKPGRPRKVTV